MPDAYAKWLEIPDHLRPPTHYQLLGIASSELDRTVIASAAERQLERLRPHLAGPESELCARIEKEIQQARDTLLDPVARQRYDQLTPDAARPWWTPDTETAPTAPPVPVEGWWQPDDSASSATSESSTPSESTVGTVPVEGWWEGTGPAPAAASPLVESVSPPVPAAASTPVLEILNEPNVPVPELPAKSDDWWKKPTEERVLAGTPPVVPTAPNIPVPPPPPPIRTPTVAPMPQPASSGPIVNEKALAFGPPGGHGSAGRWIAGGVAVIAIAGVAILLWKKPWEKAESAPIDKPIAKIEPDKKQEIPLVIPHPVEAHAKPQLIDIVPRVVDKEPKTVVKVPKVDPKPPPVVNEFTKPVTFRGHQGGVYGVAVSRSGKTILSTSDDRNVFQYTPLDESKHTLVQRMLSPGINVALCSDDREAAFCDGGDVVVFDLGSRKVKAKFENPRGGIRSLAVGGNGAFVLTGATDGAVRWWSVAKNDLDHTLDIDDKATVSALAISSDSRSAAMGLSDGRICVWDLTKQRELERWKAHKGIVTAIAFSPDGKRIVSGGDDNIGNVWQASGSLVKKLAGHEGPVLAVGWCSDGQRVITAGIDKKVCLWNGTQGWKKNWSTATADRVFCLAIDAKDRFVLAGEANGTIQLVPLPRSMDGTNE